MTEDNKVTDNYVSQRDGASEGSKFSDSIQTESDFHSFLEECKRKRISGIENTLNALSSIKISHEMRSFIADYFREDAKNNRFDKKALREFEKTNTAAKREDESNDWMYTSDRIIRISRGMTEYSNYFSQDLTSLTADKFQGFMNFLALNAPGAKIGRLTLYAFKYFYRPDGEVIVASELERIRKLMLKQAKNIHAMYDERVKAEIMRLEQSLSSADYWEKKEIKRTIKQLVFFLQQPGGLEIRNHSIDEISSRLKARNVKHNEQLNLPPEDGIFRIALRDCTIEGFKTKNGICVNIVPFNPAHYLTYAINANLLNENSAAQAREWWEYTVRTLGIDGARKYYEMVGYLIITKYPLPTERTILIIVGDPGSGKGTHLAAVQELLTFGELTLFAKAGPHKLTDPREHFSRQNLQNKLALISGDLKHNKIHDFSDVNDLFGGEPQEIEKKFKDPTIEKPTFKAIWATTPPLFKLDQAGGAWRRILLVFTHPVSDKDRDNNLKPRMLESLDGFFLNGLIGLSYLVANGWKFTGEIGDAAIEDTWAFYSDSVRVWAQNLESEPESIQRKVVKSSTLDRNIAETITEENLAARVLVDDLYTQYTEWCTKKQIEPVKPKTFSAWLSGNGYTLKKKTIEEGQFKGKRKIVTYVTWNSNDDPDQDSEMNRTVGDLSWEAYFSNAPLTIGPVPDSLGQVYACGKNCMDKTYYDHALRMPSWIGHKTNQSPETNISGSGDEITPRPIHSQDDKPQDQGDQSKSQYEPIKSDASSENSKTYRYIVMKDFPLYGHVYQPGIEFEHTIYFDNELQSGILKLVEDRKERFRDTLDRAKTEWLKNPRKFLFDFVEKEAPDTKYHSLTPKAILDMLPVPDVDLSTIYELCEELTKEGAFLKNKAGAYSVNAEFVNGGVRDFFDKGDST